MITAWSPLGRIVALGILKSLSMRAVLGKTLGRTTDGRFEMFAVMLEADSLALFVILLWQPATITSKK